jgi:hypothetical protein
LVAVIAAGSTRAVTVVAEDVTVQPSEVTRAVYESVRVGLMVSGLPVPTVAVEPDQTAEVIAGAKPPPVFAELMFNI